MVNDAFFQKDYSRPEPRCLGGLKSLTNPPRSLAGWGDLPQGLWPVE